MRISLGDQQKVAVGDGELVSPSGVLHRRAGTRARRRVVDDLVEAGGPLVTYWPGGLLEHTEVVWHDGVDARDEWRRVRTSVTSDTPRPRGRTSVATVGVRAADDGTEIALLTWHH